MIIRAVPTNKRLTSSAAATWRLFCCLAIGATFSLNAEAASKETKRSKSAKSAKLDAAAPQHEARPAQSASRDGDMNRIQVPRFSLVPTPVGMVLYSKLSTIFINAPGRPAVRLGGPKPEPVELRQPSQLNLPNATVPHRSGALEGAKGTTEDSKAAVVGPAWVPLGPAPIPNGQTQPANSSGISQTQAPVSGRVTQIVVDPADPNIAYVGTAQGGLYRTLDGGANWTPLLDKALTLAVGSLQLDPADSNTIIVGTGESNFSGDSFAGVGVYVITNVKSATPVLSGPFNKEEGTGKDMTARRGIPGVAVDPNNRNIVYVGTSTGQQGIGPQPPTPGTAANRGLYRSTNFFGTDPTFTKIPMLAGSFPGATEPNPSDYRIRDVKYEPGSSDRMFVSIADNNTATTSPPYFGGVYFTANASAPTPTFTRVLATTPGVLAPAEIAVRKIGNTVTVAVVTGEDTPSGEQGRAYKSSYDTSLIPPTGPVFVEMVGAQGFAGGQGSYNLGVDIDATDANNIYIVGTITSDGSDPRGTFIFTRDGGLTFNSNTETLHVDAHAVAVAPSNGDVIYHGNDGGVWKTTAGKTTTAWTDLNNATFSATQFQSVALHPTDRYFSIGGTQDNGTEFLMPDGKWKRADFGDGGYALIDQTATDTENVTMYHTYYNAKTVLIGFSRVKKASCATEGEWALRGIAAGLLLPGLPLPFPVLPVCDGSEGQVANGLLLTDDVNFYAPMALGPKTLESIGNTVYFGTDKLYRSFDQGDNMVPVSQVFSPGGVVFDPEALPPGVPAVPPANVPVSTIGISPQNDSVRIVGLNNGRIFFTNVGTAVTTPMVDITSQEMPATGTTFSEGKPGKYVGRAVIDPTDENVAYVVYNGNAIPGKHIWKADLSGFPAVTWTAIDGAGDTSIPDISVNAFAVDPQNPQHLYAGTDRFVYVSTDGGATWNQFGTGLPPVAVFDMAIQNAHRVLRVATHGRGMWEIPLASQPVAGPTNRLQNLSTRARVGTQDRVLIGGFIITGTGTKRTIIRAVGPSLSNNGVAADQTLQDPVLELRDADGALITQNDNWRQSPEATQIEQSGLAPQNDNEAAIIRDLAPSRYTAIVSGKNETSGIGLVETYDLGTTGDPRLGNISTRGFVETGDNVLIGGFIIGGGDAAANSTIVARVIGPSLGNQGVPQPLQDPTVELFDANGTSIAFNDNWKQSQQAELEQAQLAPTDDREAALLRSLPNGAYTAIARGANNSTGTALVELYNVL